MSLPFSLTAEGLSRVAHLPWPNDFTFIIAGKRYETTKFLASFLSPIVSQMILTDPTADTFEIPIEDPDHTFAFIMRLMAGETVNLPLAKLQFLKEVGRYLGNKELTNMRISDADTLDLTLENAVELAMSSAETPRDDVVSFIASHVSEVSSDSLKLLPVGTLLEIFSHEALKLPREAWLLEFVTQLVQSGKKDASRLISCIYLENLTREEMKQFGLLLRAGTPTGDVLERMANTLSAGGLAASRKNCSGRYLSSGTEFTYNNPNDFSGLFKWFYNTYGANVDRELTVDSRHCFENGLLKLTPSERPFRVVVDLKERALKVTGFVFEVCGMPSRDIVLKGDSGGSENWVQIGRTREGMNYNPGVRTYQACQSDTAFRKLQVTWRCDTMSSIHRDELRIELFGTLTI